MVLDNFYNISPHLNYMQGKKDDTELELSEGSATFFCESRKYMQLILFLKSVWTSSILQLRTKSD